MDCADDTDTPDEKHILLAIAAIAIAVYLRHHLGDARLSMAYGTI